MNISAIVFEIGVPVANTTPAPLFSSPGCAGTREQIERAIPTQFVGVLRNARQGLGDVEQIFEFVRSVDEESIDSKLFSNERIVFSARQRALRASR